MPENLLPVEALLIIDIQTGNVTGTDAVPDAARLLENTADLLDKARSNGALVVHVQNDGPAGMADETGTPGWELQLPVHPGATELVIRKKVDDAFNGTRLAALLQERGVSSLAICGLMSEMCVSATARTALSLGFRVVLPHDAHATTGIPPTPGISPEISPATVSRVAEWALGNEIIIPPHATDVSFRRSEGMPEIVTYLEMTSPDELAEATAVPGVRLERADSGSPLIRELLVRVGRPHQWRTLSWSEEQWAEYLTDPLRQAWFVTHDDDAGPQYAGIATYLPNSTTDGAAEVQISHFGLVPEYVGRGLGGHALTLTIQTAWTLNPSTTRVWLHTSTLDHPNALPNYQKRGLRPYATKLRED